MRHDFDVHEWNIRQLDEGLSGQDAVTQTIAYLRKKIYPNLADKEKDMDLFVIGLCQFLDCTPPSYRLNEEIGPKQKVLSINDLTFDLLKSMFPSIAPGMGGIGFPTPTDASTIVGDEKSLERWKAETSNRYGDINIKIDTEAYSPWEKIQVLDNKFRDDKQSYIDGKAATLKNWGTSV